MPIRYRCPSCGQLLGISSKLAGRTFDCPTCGNPTLVPSADAIELAPAAADEPADAERAEKPAAVAEPPCTPLARRESAAAADDVPETAATAGALARDAGGFQFKSRTLDTDEMDLTPMVDMTFLLLIFFMITASFSVQKSLAFPRPNDERKGAVQTTHLLEEFEERSVVVHIDERNVIYVDDEPLADRTRLTDVLRAALSSQRNELLLTADDNAWHEYVVAVIDAASAAGMQKIRLAAPGAE